MSVSSITCTETTQHYCPSLSSESRQSGQIPCPQHQLWLWSKIVNFFNTPAKDWQVLHNPASNRISTFWDVAIHFHIFYLLSLLQSKKHTSRSMNVGLQAGQLHETRNSVDRISPSQYLIVISALSSQWMRAWECSLRMTRGVTAPGEFVIILHLRSLESPT